MLANLAGAGGPYVDVGKVMRRSVRVGTAIAIVAITAGSLLGYWLVGLGVLVGEALSLASNRAFQARSLALLKQAGRVRKMPVASSVLLRLALVSGVVFYLLYAVPQLGWGVLAGVCAFQFLLLGNSLVALWAELRNKETY